MSVRLCGRISNPQEVVDHPQLEPEVKRAILASWASDACASDLGRRSQPPQFPNRVPVDEVLGALRRLDG